jgi:hypothetical protein
LKIGAAEQGGRFILEHLKNVFDMERSWVEAKAEGSHHVLACRR